MENVDDLKTLPQLLYFHPGLWLFFYGKIDAKKNYKLAEFQNALTTTLFSSRYMASNREIDVKENCNNVV